MYVCMYVCVCVYVCMYVCIHTCIHYIQARSSFCLRHAMASSSVEPQAQAAIDSADKLRWETSLRRAKVLAKLGIKLQPQVKAMPKAARAKVLASRRRGKLWQLAVDEHKVLAKKICHPGGDQPCAAKAGRSSRTKSFGAIDAFGSRAGAARVVGTPGS